ncbi:MAG: hypothetical protein ACKVQU_11550 [Burkholderiales bacterium]
MLVGLFQVASKLMSVTRPSGSMIYVGLRYRKTWHLCRDYSVAHMALLEEAFH